MSQTKRSSFKEHFPILLAIGMPIIMTLVVAISIYLPTRGYNPKHNFVFSDQSYYNRFEVKDGALVKKAEDTASIPGYSAPSEQLLLYNVTKNESVALTEADAMKLKIDGSVNSPDGYHVGNGYENSNGGFIPMMLFFDGGRGAVYMQKDKVKKRLNLTDPSLSYNFHFYGWIAK